MGPHGGFVGLVSEGTIAFVCTTQADNVAGKVAEDIEKVCASGHPVHEIVAFTLESVPVAACHKLQDATRETHNVSLQLFDAESISEQLATPDGFWIAEQYLEMPAEVAPSQPPSDEHLTDTYIERRGKWRDKQTPAPTIGDFIDLKLGIRFATFREAARPDLPFWLGLIRELLSNGALSPQVRQRARYELVVASLRGLNDMKPVDRIAREFLDESLGESEPARLQDAAALLTYVAGAAKNGVTRITPAEHTTWNADLTRRVEGLLDGDAPYRRASLLYTLGSLGIHPALSEDSLPEADDAPLDAPPWLLASVEVLPGEFHLTEEDFVDLPSGLAAWTELARGLEEVPLFPVDSLSQQLQFLAPVLVAYPEWPILIEKVDEAVARVSGQAAVAGRAQDRGMAFYGAGRQFEALEEFHRVKTAGWSGDTLRGALLAVLMISRIYLEIRLPQAAKAYALLAGYVAVPNGDDELADLVPRSLFQAADADYVSGAWCGAAELFECGLTATYNLVGGGLESEGPDDIDRALIHMARIAACARDVDSTLATAIHAALGGFDLQEIAEGEVDFGLPADEDSWMSYGATDLTSPPFSDLGEVRCLRFSGLGTEWVLQFANDQDSAIVAERFAAAAQIMLAALAREELCIIPTRINVRIERRLPDWLGPLRSIEYSPSDEGRGWVVRLVPARIPGSADPEQIHTELLEMLARIFRDVSLLPEAEFSAAIERVLQRGLNHKLALARPYDELVAMFSDQQIDRSRFNTPWDCLDGHYPAHKDLRWQDGPGPTFSKEKADSLLKTRYRNLEHILQRVVPYLWSEETFRRTVETLRDEGWLDWHILTAISNIILTRRFNSIACRLGPDNARRMLERVMRSPEVEPADSVSATMFTHEAMQHHRETAMLSLLNHWRLELHQPTPDFTGIESVLRARYGYWEDDIEHTNPFPMATE